jgi:hypothetical protein
LPTKIVQPPNASSAANAAGKDDDEDWSDHSSEYEEEEKTYTMDELISMAMVTYQRLCDEERQMIKARTTEEHQDGGNRVSSQRQVLH